MLRRFVAASMIASIAIALGAAALMLVPGIQINRAYPLIIIWCFVPSIWGLWAMVAPAHLVPDRLQYWGAVLGIIAAVLAIFALDMPQRFLGIDVPPLFQVLGVALAAVGYYIAWTLVKITYRHLHHGDHARP